MRWDVTERAKLYPEVGPQKGVSDSNMTNQRESTIAKEVREFVLTNFLFGQEGTGLTEQQSLLENGIIDSTGVLELVAFLEQRYGISVGDRELLPENLDSISNVTAFVTRKLEHRSTSVAD
jgi:acyl carrier protein